jgi:hypothetical protein
MRGPSEAESRLNALRVAFIDLCTGAKRLPDLWYGLTERHRSISFPFERERMWVHKAIKLGATTPAQVVQWRLAQLADDLAQFPGDVRISDVCYVQYAAEHAEALEAAATARAFPTRENRDTAIREIGESNTAARAFSGVLASGDFVRPMSCAGR